MLSVNETPQKLRASPMLSATSTATPGKSPAAASGNTPRQTDRRSRNAAARQAKADTDLINEIQAGLVQEVRRLQGLLKERDDQRVSLERSHAELEKQLDQYKPRVIQMTETEDALKQENWDLNVSKQNLENNSARSGRHSRRPSSTTRASTGKSARRARPSTRSDCRSMVTLPRSSASTRRAKPRLRLQGGSARHAARRL